MLFFLSMRNVFRARSRSLITILALFFCVGMSIILSAFVMGVGESLVAEAIESRVGAIEIHRTGYFEKRDREPIAFNIERNEQLESSIRSVANVKAVTPRLVFSGLITNGSRGTIAVITAVDPLTLKSALPRFDLYLEGQPINTNDKNGAHVAKELSTSLDLKEGVPLMLQAKGLSGRDNVVDLEPRGIMTGQNPMESKRSVTIPLVAAQSLLGMEGKITEYVVAIEDTRKLNETAQALKSKLGSTFEVQTWEELRPGLRDARLMQRVILGIISLVFLIIALFGVANTLQMSVVERTREIGTLLAVGMRRAQVGLLFVFEAISQAIIGSFAGLATALIVVALARRSGGFLISMGQGQGVFNVVPTLLIPVPFIVVISVVVGSALAALAPAVRASRMRPVEALTSL